MISRIRKSVFKVITFMFAFALIVLNSNVALADLAGYDITKYHVDINVLEDNVLLIDEYITADFAGYRHGIYRSIPQKFNVTRSDGSVSRVNTLVSDIECNTEFKVLNKISDCTIVLGDEYESVEGEVEYKISYKYTIEKDYVEGKDEFYFNIIGDEWDTKISNITFSVTMPKEFDESKVGLVSGIKGSTKTGDTYFDISDLTITGGYEDSLTNNQALTMRIELEDGYFLDNDMKRDDPFLYMIITMIVCVVIAIVSWALYGKDDPIIETVEFNAPYGLNSFELAYAYEAGVNSSDVVSLIICLASRGYIQIEEKAKDNVELTKLKEYEGENEYEKLLMETLFKKLDILTSKEIKKKFSKTLDKMRKSITTPKNKYRLFELKTKMGAEKVSHIASIPFHLATTFSFGIMYGIEKEMLFVILARPVITMFKLSSEDVIGIKIYNVLVSILGWCVTICGIYKLYYLMPGFELFMVCGIILLEAVLRCSFIRCGKAESSFWVMLISGVIMMIGLQRPIMKIMPGMILNIPVYYAGLSAALIIYSFAVVMPRRTKEGAAVLGKILGFKKFLTYAKKEELESLVKLNPSYYFNILPYAYVLGVSSEWAEKFKDMVMEPPRWYRSYRGYSHMGFNESMNSVIDNARISCNSSSFGGGGSSGGGFGGGGGGSW